MAGHEGARHDFKLGGAISRFNALVEVGRGSLPAPVPAVPLHLEKALAAEPVSVVVHKVGDQVPEVVLPPARARAWVVVVGLRATLTGAAVLEVRPRRAGKRPLLLRPPLPLLDT